MDYCKSILICGGDKRQKYMYRQMQDKGLNVRTFALGEEPSVRLDDINKFDVVIFPVPVSKDGINLYATQIDYEVSLDDILHRLSKSQIVLGGMCDNVNFDMIDYYKSETLQMENAIPTAEGALRIAMENVDFTLYGSSCLVFGYGRIGKILAQRLLSMGANVSVCARKERDLALAETMGCTAVPLEYVSSHIHRFDIIFNTIPQNIINCEMLGEIGKTVPIIDLASKPYGVDMTAARALGRKVIIASGLPGRFTPESSGKILKDIIIKMLIEMEV